MTSVSRRFPGLFRTKAGKEGGEGRWGAEGKKGELMGGRGSERG